MYRNDHNQYYRSLPVHVFHAEADPGEESYPFWFVRGCEPGRSRCYTEHRHETLEVIGVLEGKLHARLENRKFILRKGEIMVVNPFVSHAGDYYAADGVMRYIGFQMELEFFMPAVPCELRENMARLLNGCGQFEEHIAADHPASGEVFGLMEKLLALWFRQEQGAGAACSMMALIYETLGCMLDAFYRDTPADVKPARDLQFIRRVVQYLDGHYSEKLSTSVVSEALSYNLNHFCNLFRENFGTGFSHYLCDYRIARALNDYCGSSMHVSEIAAAVGFRDYGYFAEAFKKYTGITPSAFFLGKGRA